MKKKNTTEKDINELVDRVELIRKVNTIIKNINFVDINKIINFIHEWCEYDEKINRCTKGLSKYRCNDLLKMLNERRLK